MKNERELHRKKNNKKEERKLCCCSFPFSWQQQLFPFIIFFV